jgi:hypothetical protein
MPFEDGMNGEIANAEPKAIAMMLRFSLDGI